MAFTKENAAAYGKKGAEATNGLKKAKKRMSVKEVMLLLLENPDNKEQLCKGLIESASKGNAKSAELLLKIIGEDPSKQEKEVADDPFE